MTRKEFQKYLLSKKDSKLKSTISLTYYIKGNNNNWYCELYYYDDNIYYQETLKATGYGYDKKSTCVSNAINIFKDIFKRYNKNAKKYTRYGLYQDNSISYGIGIGAVLGCVKCFKNAKIKSTYNGINENNIIMEVIL